jgi:hypothetical protein
MLLFRRFLNPPSAAMAPWPSWARTCTLLRCYASTSALRGKRQTSVKRCKHEGRRRHASSRSTSSKKRKIAEAVTPVSHEHLQVTSVQFSSSARGAAATTVADLAAPLTPPKRSTQERERELLRYFGRARHHYDIVPLHKATAALQCASRTQASRVPFATLFPLPPVSSSSVSLLPYPAATLNADTAASAVSPLPLFAMNTTTTTTTTAAASVSLLSRDAIAFSPSHLFVGYDHKLRQNADWTMSRALNNRFGSTVDANKDSGACDVQLHDIAHDTAELWTRLCAAWEAMLQRCARLGGLQEAVPLQHTVCFLLLFSQTREAIPVAASMQAVAQETMRRCRMSGMAGSSVFAVVPVYVGLEGPTPPHTPCEKLDTATSRSKLLCGGASPIVYPSGGLYTCSAVVQCLARVKPHTCKPAPAAGGKPHRTFVLKTDIFLVSDAWLNPRNLADLYSTHLRTFNRTASMAAQKEDDGAALTPLQHPPSFIPDETRQRVHVFPGVVCDRLSVKEQTAFGSYLWSMMRRASASDAVVQHVNNSAS